MNARLTVSLVTWNSSAVLRPCLLSLARQSVRDFRLTVIDNASLDDSLELVQEAFPQASVIRHSRNLGFGRAHNQTIQLTTTPLVLVLNPDTILEPTAIERLVGSLTADPRIGVVGPKLLRYDLGPGDPPAPVTTQTIDSAGIVRTAWGACLDRGANETDHGQYDRPEHVFGVSAACALFRRQALDDVRLNHEYFDEDFFAYKEDVDLGWRLQHRGWHCRYEPRAVAYHRRGFGRLNSPLAVRAVIATRRRQRQRSKTLSYRNHLLTLVKNQPAVAALRQLPLTVGYELGKLLYLAVTEPKTLVGLGQALRLVPRMVRKRQRILGHRFP